MPSQTVVTVNVVRSTAIPTRAGFGTILAAVYHSQPGSLVREFGSIAEIASTFSADPNYPAINRLASVVFSQNPRPTKLKIGKRTTGALTQEVQIKPIAVQGEGFVWSFLADDRAITFTEPPGVVTIADIVAGLVASPDWTSPTALDLTPTDVASTTINVAAATTNVVHSFGVDLGLFDFEETTLDPGLATDLTAFQGLDEDWYGLILDSNSPNEIVAASTWVEARVKLLGADAYLSNVPDPVSSTDVASVLQTAQREKTYTYWTAGRDSRYYAAGAMAYMFAAWEPGRATWHLQPLLGVDAYGELVQGRQQALEDKNVLHLEPFGGVQSTMQGKVAAGEFIDVVRYSAYAAARAKETAQATLLAQTRTRGKVPYTDSGIALVTGDLQVFFNQEILDGALISAVVTAPSRASIASADIAERLLPDIEIALVYAGAIHEVDILIILSL